MYLINIRNAYCIKSREGREIVGVFKSTCSLDILVMFLQVLVINFCVREQKVYAVKQSNCVVSTKEEELV